MPFPRSLSGLRAAEPRELRVAGGVSSFAGSRPWLRHLSVLARKEREPQRGVPKLKLSSTGLTSGECGGRETIATLRASRRSCKAPVSKHHNDLVLGITVHFWKLLGERVNIISFAEDPEVQTRTASANVHLLFQTFLDLSGPLFRPFRTLHLFYHTPPSF